MGCAVSRHDASSQGVSSSMGAADLMLFSLNAGEALGRAVARVLGVELGKHEERSFEDGEHKIRPLEDVEHRDVYLVQSLFGEPGSSVNDRLVKLLFFAGALRDAGARRINAVVPYLCYARKDRRTQSRDPISMRYIAQLFEAIRFDTVTSLDVHNDAAFDNAFRCRTVHLSARCLFARHVAKVLDGGAITVASPDLGGAKRAAAFRQVLQEVSGRPVGYAIMEKHRSEGIVSGELVAGDIAGHRILLLDDLIAGGGTMRRAARALLEAGAAKVYAIATHAVFGEGAMTNLSAPELSGIITTNSVVSETVIHPQVAARLVRLDIAPMLADNIATLHAADVR